VLWILANGGAAIVPLSLVFSWQVHRSWLGRAGLHMTVLGIGTAMFIAATAQTQWKAPLVFAPLLKIGQYSYEVYLTHAFVVLTFFGLFLDAGRQMRWVPVLFVATILVSGFLGAAVARLYSEPMNSLLRRKLKSSAKKLSPIQAAYAPDQLQDGTVAPS
jgi:peptidoglycan/LPS O-acetylase OafA/YrhL